MFSRFFIDRPIFASVLSIVITLTGAIAASSLPLSLYPPVSPPNVSVSCTFPGADAQTVSEAVASPLEEQINGVENMLYMSSTCTNDGGYSLTITFEHGVDLNLAQIRVQNRVSLALPKLPDVIKQTGVLTRKRAPDILMSVALISPDGRYDQLYLSNFALMRCKEELARVPGVGDISMYGQKDYSMRIWVDPQELAARSMTAGDVVAAIREQNMPVAAGQIGQPPIGDEQAIQLTLSTQGRLVEPEEFADIIIRCTPEGRITRIRDIGRVEMGAKNSDQTCQVNHAPASSIAIYQLPDANALETAVRVRAKMAELQKDFPPGIEFMVRYDTTPYIRETVQEVFKTLRESVILVAIVVLLFLQSWRSAVIPLIAVPVAIIGTFGVMAALGFSLNNLTLFGLVLSIGIVVDDAIVVVEAAEHHIEHGLAPRDATIRAMNEVSGPVIAIGLVLAAVFVPCAFISGITGQFFRQFALTITSSTLISTINSLTLSPALAALLLRPRGQGRNEVLPRWTFALFGGWLGFIHIAGRLEPTLAHWGALNRLANPAAAAWWISALLGVAAGVLAGWVASRPLDWLLGTLFHRFNAGFARLTNAYTRLVGMALRASVLVLVVYCGLSFLTYKGFVSTPKGFIPPADMGYLQVNLQLPDSASLERTIAVMDRLETIAHETPGVGHTQAMSGQSMVINAAGSNFASLFVILDDFSERRDPLTDRIFQWLNLDARQAAARRWLGWSGGKKADIEERLRRWLKLPKTRSLNINAVIADLRKRFEEQALEADVKLYPAPPLRGVGRAGGFNIVIEDRGDNGPRALQYYVDRMTDNRNRPPVIANLFSAFRANVPQFYADVDRTECMTREVDLQDLFETLRIYLGSLYVNDFNRFGRTWQVIVQADSSFRKDVSDIKLLKVRNIHGTMIPVATLATFREKPGPLVLTRYNMYPSATINGNALPGVSSGVAMKAMEDLATKNPETRLPPSMTYEWTELAYFEKKAGNTAMMIFAMAVVAVFLVLAAQYESWSLPLAVILVVPMCLLSAIAGVRLASDDINIFTQVGFVVLVGLASKNAILIVEFAKHHREAGESRWQATLEACRLRLRPIVMTSLAFILGVLPLLLGQGAGAEMRRTLGTTVFSGMLGVTLFGILLTPVFFYVIDWLSEARLWHSPLFRWIDTWVLGTLSLRPVRQLARTALRPAGPALLGELVPEFEPETETETEPETVPAEPK